MFNDDELEWLSEALGHYYSYIKVELTQPEIRFHKGLEEKIEGLLNP